MCGFKMDDFSVYNPLQCFSRPTTFAVLSCLNFELFQHAAGIFS